MGTSLMGDIFGLVDSGGSCISTVAMVRACEAIQARLVATLSIVRELKVRVDHSCERLDITRSDRKWNTDQPGFLVQVE